MANCKKTETNNKQDILQEISFEKLVQLKDLLLNNKWPRAAYVSYFVNTYMRIKRNDPDAEIHLWCPEGQWKYGTFVALYCLGSYNIITFTIEEDGKILKKALRETSRIDWKRSPLLSALHIDMHIFLFDVVENDLNCIMPELTPTGYWLLSKDKALDLEITLPADLYVKPLKESESEIVNSYWPHKYPNSHRFLGGLIKYNGSLGLYSKEDNTLRAWVLINEFEGLGMIHTREEYRRKGYAKILAKTLSKQIATDFNHDVVAFIVKGNTKSENLFSSLGFTQNKSVAWISIRNKTQ